MKSAMSESCPDQAQLVALLDSSLSVEDSDVIEKHVASCAACEERLAALASQDSDDWSALRQVLDTKFGNESDLPVAKEFDAEALVEQLSNHGFDILHELGRGGMGIVFAARQPAIQRTVAIKMLMWGTSAGTHQIQRMVEEAKAIGQLNQENVLKIFDTIDSDGMLGLVLEYADRGSLVDQLSDGPIPPNDAMRIATQAAAGLAHAHENNILHRDIKPANLLLCSSADETIVKLADFGLAKDTDRSVELTGSLIIGSPKYMSPEQFTGRNDSVCKASDVYSLGVVLYEMLVGAPPFRGPNAAAIHHLVATQPPVPPRQIQPSISLDLETICLKCLEKSPADRYSSAKELLDDLQRLSDGLPILARRANLPQRALKWCRRKPAAAALIATAGVAVIAIAAVWGVMTAQLSQVNAQLAGKNDDLQTQNSELDALISELNSKNEALRLQQEKTYRQLRATKALRSFLTNDLLANASAVQRMNEAAKSGDNVDKAPQELTARELVFRAIEELEGDGLEEKFPQQPNVQAEVLTALATIMNEMGEYDVAVDLGKRAIEVHPGAEQDFDKEHFDNLLSYSVQLISKGDFKRVIEVCTLILEQAEKHGEKELQFSAMHNMAGSHMLLDQPEIGVEFSEGALNGFTELLGVNDPMTLQATATHGQILQDLGRYADAAVVLEKSVAGFTELVTEKHPRTISAIGKLASVLTSAKEYDRAIEMYRKEISLSNEVLGPDHPKSIMAEANLGSCIYKSGEIADGIDVMTKANKKLIEKVGADHYFVKGIEEAIEKAKKLLH